MHVQTKQENLKRILARFEEKKTKVVGSNRDDRRMKEKEAKMQQKQAQRDRKRAAGGTEAQVSVPKSPPLDSGVAQGRNEEKEGLLDKIQQSSFKSAWMNDINEVSRSQAMQVPLPRAPPFLCASCSVHRRKCHNLCLSPPCSDLQLRSLRSRQGVWIMLPVE